MFSAGEYFAISLLSCLGKYFMLIISDKVNQIMQIFYINSVALRFYCTTLDEVAVAMKAYMHSPIRSILKCSHKVDTRISVAMLQRRKVFMECSVTPPWGSCLLFAPLALFVIQLGGKCRKLQRHHWQQGRPQMVRPRQRPGDRLRKRAHSTLSPMVIIN